MTEYFTFLAPQHSRPVLFTLYLYAMVDCVNESWWQSRQVDPPILNWGIFHYLEIFRWTNVISLKKSIIFRNFPVIYVICDVMYVLLNIIIGNSNSIVISTNAFQVHALVKLTGCVFEQDVLFAFASLNAAA